MSITNLTLNREGNNTSGAEVYEEVLKCKGFPPMLATKQIMLMYTSVGVICILLAVVITSLNCLVLYAFIVTKRCKRPVDILLVLLTTTDLTLGIFTLPLYANIILHMGQNTLDCSLAQLLKTVTYCLVEMTLTNIGLISMQVYLSISRPFFYMSTRNERGYRMAIGTVWMLIVVVNSCVFYLTPQFEAHLKLALGIASCVTMITLFFSQVSNFVLKLSKTFIKLFPCNMLSNRNQQNYPKEVDSKSVKTFSDWKITWNTTYLLFCSQDRREEVSLRNLVNLYTSVPYPDFFWGYRFY